MCIRLQSKIIVLETLRNDQDLRISHGQDMSDRGYSRVREKETGRDVETSSKEKRSF